MMVLFAQITASEETCKFFDYLRFNSSEGPGSTARILTQIAVVTACTLLIIFLLYLSGLLQPRRSQCVTRQPKRLFRGLLHDLGLPFTDRCLLRLIAYSSGLPHPTTLLLSPQLLERYGRPWVQRVVIPAVRVAAWQRLDHVSRRLHGAALGRPERHANRPHCPFFPRGCKLQTAAPFAFAKTGGPPRPSLRKRTQSPIPMGESRAPRTPRLGSVPRLLCGCMKLDALVEIGGSNPAQELVERSRRDPPKRRGTP